MPKPIPIHQSRRLRLSASIDITHLHPHIIHQHQLSPLNRIRIRTTSRASPQLLEPRRIRLNLMETCQCRDAPGLCDWLVAVFAIAAKPESEWRAGVTAYPCRLQVKLVGVAGAGVFAGIEDSAEAWFAYAVWGMLDERQIVRCMRETYHPSCFAQVHYCLSA